MEVDLGSERKKRRRPSDLQDEDRHYHADVDDGLEDNHGYLPYYYGNADEQKKYRRHDGWLPDPDRSDTQTISEKMWVLNKGNRGGIGYKDWGKAENERNMKRVASMNSGRFADLTDMEKNALILRRKDVFDRDPLGILGVNRNLRYNDSRFAGGMWQIYDASVPGRDPVHILSLSSNPGETLSEIML